MGVKKSIIFGLAMLDKVLTDLRDPGGILSFSYYNLYGFVPSSYRRDNLYGIVRNLKKSGEVERIAGGNFYITSLFRQRFRKLYPLLEYSRHNWDRKWRLVGFDIEEKKKFLRDALRHELKLHGFAMLQKSLYITPHPVERDMVGLIDRYKRFLSNVYFFVSDEFSYTDKIEFVNRVFQIDKLDTEYKNLIVKLKSCSDDEERYEIVRQFLEISMRDPFLPHELLPADFARDKVWRLIKQVYGGREFDHRIRDRG